MRCLRYRTPIARAISETIRSSTSVVVIPHNRFSTDPRRSRRPAVPWSLLPTLQMQGCSQLAPYCPEPDSSGRPSKLGWLKRSMFGGVAPGSIGEAFRPHLTRCQPEDSRLLMSPSKCDLRLQSEIQLLDPGRSATCCRAAEGTCYRLTSIKKLGWLPCVTSQRWIRLRMFSTFAWSS